MGRPRQSLLAPFLRSEAQGRVLAAVLLADESQHLRAIADRSQVAYSVVQREVDRLEQAGLVSSTRFATTRSVRANERHRLFSELRALMLKAYGPREVLGGLLARESGVDEAFVYGSWASRYEGVWGPPPADVDVLLIGNLNTSRIEGLEAEAEDLLGQPVHITAVPREDWERRAGAFLRTVRQRPIVAIDLGNKL